MKIRLSSSIKFHSLFGIRFLDTRYHLCIFVSIAILIDVQDVSRRRLCAGTVRNACLKLPLVALVPMETGVQGTVFGALNVLQELRLYLLQNMLVEEGIA